MWILDNIWSTSPKLEGPTNCTADCAKSVESISQLHLINSFNSSGSSLLIAAKKE
jgi:hypothetical protein